MEPFCVQNASLLHFVPFQFLPKLVPDYLKIFYSVLENLRLPIPKTILILNHMVLYENNSFCLIAKLQIPKGKVA
jgi:hypothetical protein